MGWVGRFVCRLGWAWAAPRRAHRAREAVEASREHAGRLQQPMVAASTLPQPLWGNCAAALCASCESGPRPRLVETV